MSDSASFYLYFGHGDRVEEVRRLLGELRGQLSGCRYDCWYQPQTEHTILTLTGSCDALRERLSNGQGWYLQPLSWKQA